MRNRSPEAAFFAGRGEALAPEGDVSVFMRMTLRR